jgi:hypothetical protein
MKRKTFNWVDYTRRNDPAQPFFVDHLKAKLEKHGYPHVLCFWTKSPSKVATLYKDIIKDMQSHDCLVLLQTTINSYSSLEPTLTEDDIKLDDLIPLLGSPEHIRFRFDPIIPGYTSIKHYTKVLELAKKYGVTRITTNFIVPSYKNVSSVLMKLNIRAYEATEMEKIDSLTPMVKLAADYGVSLVGCAELNRDGIIDQVPGLIRSGCADFHWAEKLKPEYTGLFRVKPSRPGCLCCYDDDWGLYKNNGAPACVHKCAYCYAK